MIALTDATAIADTVWTNGKMRTMSVFLIEFPVKTNEEDAKEITNIC